MSAIKSMRYVKTIFDEGQFGIWRREDCCACCRHRQPFFTTDSAASLRAVEIDADILIKATKVDGVYSADPMEESSATLYKRLSYDDVLDRKLSVWMPRR